MFQFDVYKNPDGDGYLLVVQADLLNNLYCSNVTRRMVKRPKLSFLDTGLCAYLNEWLSPETLEAKPMSGSIIETYNFFSNTIRILESAGSQG